MAYAKGDPRSAAAKRKYYLAHRQEYYNRNAKKRRRIGDWLKDYKESRPCTDCKLFFPFYVMDFDHLDPATKKFEPNQFRNYMSWASMETEIAKCELVCSNCHRVRTHRRRDEVRTALSTATSPASLPECGAKREPRPPLSTS